MSKQRGWCPDCGAVSFGNLCCDTCRAHWPGGDPVQSTEISPTQECRWCGQTFVDWPCDSDDPIPYCSERCARADGWVDHLCGDPRCTDTDHLSIKTSEVEK